MIPKAKNLTTPNGTTVPNQIEIVVGDETYFQSYDALVVHKDSNGQVFLGDSWDYSRTTSKYVGRFLNKSAAEIRKLINNGTYNLVSYLD